MSDAAPGGSGAGERLQKVLAAAGVASRRHIEEMIRAGRIRVNGRTARIGQRVRAEEDTVEVDGAVVGLRSDLVHYLLNKPAGVVSTASRTPRGARRCWTACPPSRASTRWAAWTWTARGCCC